MVVESKQALNLNLSSQCLQSVFQLVYGFSTYKKGNSLQEGANYFIAVRNCSGLPLSVRLQDDGGIANLMDETAQVNVDDMDKTFFAGLAEVQIAERVAICWVEFHELVPFIRVFLRIPFLREVGKSDYFGSSFEVFCCESENGDNSYSENADDSYSKNGDNSYSKNADDSYSKSADGPAMGSARSDACSAPLLFPVLSFVNQQADSLGQIATILVASKEEQLLWIRFANEMKRRYEAFLSSTASEVLPTRYDVLYFSEADSTQATALPAHPSLALLQLGLPFRRLRNRSLLFEFEGYPSFSCNVDELKEQAVVLDSKEMNTLQFIIRSEVKRGRKVITVGTPIAICNETSCLLSYSIKSNRRRRRRRREEEEEISESEKSEDDFMEIKEEKKSKIKESTSSEVENQIQMEKGRNYFVPYLNLEKGSVSLSMQNTKNPSKTKKISTELIQTNKANGTMNFGTPDDPIYISACEEIREIPIMGIPGVTLTTFRLVFSDILEVENCIPEPLEMGFMNPEGRLLAIRMLRPGGREIIRQFMFLKREGIRISLRLAERNFEFSQYKDSIAVGMVWRV